MSAMEIERFLHHGLIGRSGLPEDVMVQRKALARAEIEHFTKLLDDPPIGVQIGIVTDTLPHTGFQLFRQPERKILVLSPFRLGGEPNVRVGVAMITSAPDALAFHEAAIDEMWGRALKGQAAANLVRHLLANRGRPIEDEDFTQAPDNAKATPTQQASNHHVTDERCTSRDKDIRTIHRTDRRPRLYCAARRASSAISGFRECCMPASCAVRMPMPRYYRSTPPPH